MKATITIKMDNAAFDEAGYELASVLNKLATQIKASSVSGGGRYSIRDSNGNVVGELKITGKRD